jgi:hypothetical protein
MSNFKDIVPLTKTKVFTNVIVFIFIYIFLKPTTQDTTIKHKDYHTHCVKTTTLSKDSQYIDLESDFESHIHKNVVKHNVQGHSHNPDSKRIPILKTPENYNKNNLYVARYDRHLEYLLKAFVVLVVLTSMLVFNAMVSF